MSSNWKSIGSEKARQHALYGIKGWLLLFLAGNFIGLLWMWAPVNSVAMDQKISIGQLLSINAPEIVFLKAALYMEIALTVVTIFLIFTKNQYFRLITILGRLIFWPTLGAVALSQGISETGNALAQSFFPWAVSCAIWVTYLQRSKRVRVTFEHCVRNDEHEAVPEAVSTSSTHTSQANVTMPSSDQSLVIPANDRPMAMQQNELHSVTSAMSQAGLPIQNANYTAIRPTMKNESQTEEDHWATAMFEVESGQRRPGVWAKAFAASEGDETKAKVAYLKARVQQLTDAAKELEAKEEAEKQKKIFEAQAAIRANQEELEQSIHKFQTTGTVSSDELKRLVQHPDKTRIVSLTDSTKGNTLLHTCAESDMLDEVNALLMTGADPLILNNKGLRPGCLTTSWTTRLLISGTDIPVGHLKRATEARVELDGDKFSFGDHTFSDLKEAIDYSIVASKMPQAELRQAVLKGNWSTAKNLLESGISPHGMDINGSTLLDHAKGMGDKLLIDLLEYHGAE